MIKLGAIFLCLASFVWGQKKVPTDLVELKFRLIFSNKEYFLKPCLKNLKACKLNPDQFNLINKLDKEWNPETSTGLSFNKILFYSHKQYLEVYNKKWSAETAPLTILDRKTRTLYLNLDKLTEEKFNNEGSFLFILETLFQESIKQLDPKKDINNDIATKISGYWKIYFESILPKLFNETSIEVLVFKGQPAKMMILDSIQSYSLNERVSQKLTCPEGSVFSEMQKLEQFKFRSFKKIVISSFAELIGTIQYSCISLKSVTSTLKTNISLVFEFSGMDKKQFIPDSTVINLSPAVQVK